MEKYGTEIIVGVIGLIVGGVLTKAGKDLFEGFKFTWRGVEMFAMVAIVGSAIGFLIHRTKGQPDQGLVLCALFGGIWLMLLTAYTVLRVPVLALRIALLERHCSSSKATHPAPNRRD